MINNLQFANDGKRETVKTAGCSRASGPAGGRLTCWDEDVLAFCHWKIRAYWQGNKHLGGVSWARENHWCTAQHSFHCGQKQPQLCSIKEWFGFTKAQIQSSAGVKTVWAFRKAQVTSQMRTVGWEAPTQGDPAGKKNYTALSSLFHLGSVGAIQVWPCWISTALFNKQVKKAAIILSLIPAC